MRVIATAGHVDHGKSTLVRALTGTDPDRLAEEKARGLTIDLGFAWTTLPSGQELAFVDVPGHVRFIRNMLAGVGSVDACLFVVAATEGWKPQSEEHLRILELLGMAHGVVALTKSAIVDDDTLELRRLELADRLAGSFLAGAEVVAVDGVSGSGVEDLRRALERLAVGVPAAPDRGRPRLWVDRVFAARGSGTVVTGTLTGGTVTVGAAVAVEPGARPARIRALQSHQRSRDDAGPGQRLAMNLAGIHHDEVGRGDAVVLPGQWQVTGSVDASLSVLASLDHEVSRRGAFHLYVGSGELPVAVRVLGNSAVAPGTEGKVRLHLSRPLPLLPGDRYVLRESGRGETVGGGEVLDVAPRLRASRARPDRSVDRVVREHGWITVADLLRLTGERRPASVGEWVVDPPVRAEAEATLRSEVVAAGRRGLDVSALDDRRRALLQTLPGVAVAHGRATAANRESAEDALRTHPFVHAVNETLFAPPPPDGIDRGVLRELVQRGELVEVEGLHFATAAIPAAAQAVAELLAVSPEGVTVSAVRETLGTTRKWAVPLLAHLDATGVTRRRGDLRIAGPRLPDL